jgi:hypothetical protein
MLESDHNENQAVGKQGEADHRHHKHSPWKKRNGSTPLGYLGRTALRKEQCDMQTYC